MSNWSVRVETIKDLITINGCDNIVLATFVDCGWKCIVKISEFKPGDKCIYFPIDSVAPEDDPRFAFLKSKYFRIKTMKMRGAISQGLALPLSMFPEIGDSTTDLQDILKIKKYQPDEYQYNPMCSARRPEGNFPEFLVKTDQERVQNIPFVVTDPEFRGLKVEVTEKLHGTSCTFYVKDGKFGVCSRNLELKEPTGDEKVDCYWYCARKYGIDKLLGEKLNEMNIAIQGEIIGPKICGNNYKRDDFEFYAFDVFNIDLGIYLKPALRKEFLNLHGIPKVPTKLENFEMHWDTVDDLLKYVESICSRSLIWPDVEAEGVVIRSEEIISHFRRGYNIDHKILSFKAISNSWLLKYE